MTGHIPIIVRSASSLHSMNTSSSGASDLAHTATGAAPTGFSYLKLLTAVLPDPPTTPRRHTHSAGSPLVTQVTPEDVSPRVQPVAMTTTIAPEPMEAGSPHKKSMPNLKNKRSLRFLPGFHSHGDGSKSHTDVSMPPTPKARKARNRLTRRKLSVGQFDMVLPPGPSGSGGALALMQGNQANPRDQSSEQSRRFSAFSNVPCLPELDFGIPSATPNLPALDVGALAGPQAYRCDIHSPNSADYLAAERECKLIVVDSGGRILTLTEYLGGFLYELPALTPNPLSTGDETQLGGRIVVESYTPLPEIRLDGLRMNPYGGVAEVSGRMGMGGGKPPKTNEMRSKLIEVGKGRDGKDRGTQTEKWIEEREEVYVPPPVESPMQRLGILPDIYELDEEVPRSPTVDCYEAAQIQTARRVAMKRMGFVGPRSARDGSVIATRKSDDDHWSGNGEGDDDEWESFEE